VRFNFRGVGGSGAWDEGRGEVDDALAVIACAAPTRRCRWPWRLLLRRLRRVTQAARRGCPRPAPQRLVLVGPAVQNFRCRRRCRQDTPGDPWRGRRGGALSAVLDWARPQALPVTVVPGVGHFFHGQLGLLKQLISGAWHG
jgi:hypothetical protein